MGSLPVADELTKLLDEISSKLHSLTTKEDLYKNTEVRDQLLILSRKLTAEIEGPKERLRKICFQHYEFASIRIALELGIFDLVKTGSSISAIELAKRTRADRVLLARILRVLTAMHFLRETGVESYAATPISESISSRSPLLHRHNVKHMFDNTMIPVGKLPEFFANNGYKNPEVATAGPFSYAFETQLDFWTWLTHHPERLENMNESMVGRRHARLDVLPWFKVYPVKENLIAGLRKDQDAVLLVDVGGGRGLDIEAFRAEYPSPPGRLVLEEQPNTIDENPTPNPPIEPVKYSAFLKQPVIGARAYYMHQLLDTFNNPAARSALQNTAIAMTPGYSKLFIQEFVLPPKGTALYQADLDLHMMVLNTGVERTEAEWQELLDSAGLRIVKIWSLGRAAESLIEAEKKE